MSADPKWTFFIERGALLPVAAGRGGCGSSSSGRGRTVGDSCTSSPRHANLRVESAHVQLPHAGRLCGGRPPVRRQLPELHRPLRDRGGGAAHPERTSASTTPRSASSGRCSWSRTWWRRPSRGSWATACRDASSGRRRRAASGASPPSPPGSRPSYHQLLLGALVHRRRGGRVRRRRAHPHQRPVPEGEARPDAGLLLRGHSRWGAPSASSWAASWARTTAGGTAFFVAGAPGLVLGLLAFRMKEPPRGAGDGVVRAEHTFEVAPPCGLLRVPVLRAARPSAWRP